MVKYMVVRKMIKTVSLTPDLIERISELAHARQVSFSEVVEQTLIDELLTDAVEKARQKIGDGDE